MFFERPKRKKSNPGNGGESSPSLGEEVEVPKIDKEVSDIDKAIALADQRNSLRSDPKPEHKEPNSS